jgi:hypothetical protein
MMNELIRELAYEAEDYADGIVDQGGEFHPAYTQKLAELIVRECIRVPYDMWDKAELNADVAVKIEYRIKEHFGVGE